MHVQQSLEVTARLWPRPVRPLGRLWSRMTFTARLAMSAGLALAVAASALLYSSTRSDAEFHRKELAQQLAIEIASLLPAIADQAVIGDYAIIRQTLAARAQRDNIAGAVWTDHRGARVYSDHDAGPRKAPDWFARWADVRDITGSQALEIGGRAYGTIAVTMSPVPAVNVLWKSFVNHILILGLAVGLDFLGIVLILRTGLRPLDALVAGAEAFGGGEHSVRLREQGSPELRRTVHAFNRMAGDIENLLVTNAQREERLRRREAWLTEYVAVTSSTASASDKTTGLLRLGRRHFGMELACVTRIEDDCVVLEQTDPPGAIAAGKSIPLAESWSGQVVRSGRPLHFCSAEEAPAGTAPLGTAASAWIGQPIFVGGTVSGVLHFSARAGRRAFDADDLGLIRLIADWVGLTRTLDRHEAALHREKELAQVTLQSIGDGVITTDAAGMVTYLNPVAENLTGWPLEEATGLPLGQVFSIVNEFSGEVLENPVTRVLREDVVVGLANHTLLIARDGREFIIEDSAAPIRGRDGITLGVVMVFHDVTGRRVLEREISWQAAHDPLTGLANRREFERRLEETLRVAPLEDGRNFLLYIDLDQFKVVNDTCGHAAGDELLRQVAVLLQDRVRTRDTLARLGGDEFGVLLDGCPGHKATQIAEMMVEAIRDHRFVWKDKVFVIGASIGLVGLSHHSADMQSIMSAADTACYLAKENGRNQVQLYDVDNPELDKRHGEMTWVSLIAEALENERLFLFYQRIVHARDVDAAPHREILLRMRRPNGEWALPGAFIPAAERYGLMSTLDQWVVRAALSAYRRFADSGGERHGEIWAINLSGASLARPEFHEFLRAEFGRQGVPPQAICFEVTETAAIANLAHASAFIRSMKELGCRFALDDFGSGMSSFAYLKSFPVDYLKIDGAFVRDVASDPSDLAIVKSITRIGHALGLKTIAEFVEDERTAEVLARLGVDYLQGFGVHMPEPLVVAAPVANQEVGE